MGAACCVASKDRTIICGSPVTVVQRQSHYSPSWSFRWDNRGRVVGEETTVDWLRNEGRHDDQMEVKSGTTGQATFASSDEGSPLDSFRSLTLLKSQHESNGSRKSSKLPSSDPVTSRYDGKVRESFGSPSASCSSPPGPSISPMSPSTLSSQSHLLPANAAPLRGHHRSTARPFLSQVSDSQILKYRSPTFLISEEPPSFPPPVWGNESTRGSNGGSSENWSIPGFSEQLTSTPRERWSFDSEVSSLSQYRNNGHKHGSSFDLQTCGICSKLLNERSSWSWTTQKLITLNEIAVVSVLTCGHVYHGECLEFMTPEINKYDPACPVCTYGAKKTAKMCEKALRAELESMARRRSQKSVGTTSNISVDTLKTSVDSRRAAKMISSSSGSQSFTGKPFLQRHFSIGPGTSPSMSKNQSTPRKSFFWAKSSKY